MSKFLDLNGLDYFWDKIVTKINDSIATKANIIHTLLGQNNRNDPNDDYLLMVGNGTDSSHKNTAFAIDADGNTFTDGTAVVQSMRVKGGTLAAITPLSDGYITMVDTDIDSRMGATHPSSDLYGSGVSSWDVNSDCTGYMETMLETNGRLSKILAVKRADSNGDNPVTNALYLRINDDGSRNIGVSESAPWREALNAVNKAGDYLTGSLKRKGTFDTTASSPSEETHNVIDVRDVNDIITSQFRGGMASDNKTFASLIARRGVSTDSSGIIQNQIVAYVTNDPQNRCAYFVTDPKAFRSAIYAANRPTQLYANTSGNNGSVTLANSASAADYTWLRIFYYTKGSGSNFVAEYHSVTVYNPNKKYVILHTLGPGYSTDTSIEFHGRLCYINGGSISNAKSLAGTFNSTQGTYNEVYITRVEGWNY